MHPDSIILRHFLLTHMLQCTQCPQDSSPGPRVVQAADGAYAFSSACASAANADPVLVLQCETWYFTGRKKASECDESPRRCYVEVVIGGSTHWVRSRYGPVGWLSGASCWLVAAGLPVSLIHAHGRLLSFFSFLLVGSRYHNRLCSSPCLL